MFIPLVLVLLTSVLVFFDETQMFMVELDEIFVPYFISDLLCFLVGRFGGSISPL